MCFPLINCVYLLNLIETCGILNITSPLLVFNIVRLEDHEYQMYVSKDLVTWKDIYVILNILVPTEEMAATMGFSGFGKKAREFELDELVEETRKSAIDKNRENIGKILI